MNLYGNVLELYGRKIQLVRIDGTGGISDAVAARADADKAAAAGVFAVIGGPAQAKQFSDELAQKHILCVGTCIVAQPQKYYTDNSPYMWPGGPSPDQTSTMVVELIKKQLLGKPAQFGGPDQNGKPRTFTLLTYDTPDGQYKSSWDDLEQKMKDAGADVKAHVNYYLNFADARARRPHDRGQAEPARRQGDHHRVHRRPAVPALPHGGDDEEQLLPRVGDVGHGVRRHERVRAQLRPEAVGARVRPAAHPGPAAEGEAGRVHRAPVVVRHAAADRKTASRSPTGTCGS